ncbi:hypothetical protein O1611_g7106 [Lasiodiplodia mahajangana]|uniref:Uncharacterized protein n=1 Tax=Lasiodiplodia mahajangana TaxID=1108764 RepID=A0ACC2JG87_9PEZI|nr:hypothetical protein O1611_g7106 [Lasiodiplodia mahajangana]
MFTPLPQLRASETSLDGPPPPVVHISREIQLSSEANEAYNAALDQHGPVIMVPRHGRNEYVIDHRYAHEVLTETKNFVFDTAVLDMLSEDVLTLFEGAKMIKDIESLIEQNVQPRINAIINQIYPVFQRYFDNMEDNVKNRTGDGKFAELPGVYFQLQLAIAHAMTVMILGQAHESSTMANHFAAVAGGMAKMTGLYENTDGWDRFPRLWAQYNSYSTMFFIIIPRFFLAIVPMLWKSRKERMENGLAARHGEYVPLFDILLTEHYHKKSGLSALRGFLQCAIVCLGAIFASIHQTVVAGTWILVKLTQVQNEYLPALRKEWESVNPPGENLDVKKLNQLTLLDSFIREVMRTKGDMWGPCRHTTKRLRIGPYVLPKKAICLILLSRAHQHPDNYGEKGDIFDGFQWQKEGRTATQISPEYLSFGLGRSACPGRQLAVHEIKILLYLFFSKFDIKLKEGSFRIVDHMNTTSVAPEATLLLRPREEDAEIGAI